MRNQKSLILLIIIMTFVVACAGVVGIYVLYTAAFEQQRARLVETAQNQATLLSTVSDYDAHPADAEHPAPIKTGMTAAALTALQNYRGFGKTGELNVAKRAGDWIVYLIQRRFIQGDNPELVPFASQVAQPMRLALLGASGTTIALDYRGRQVLAAYAHVQGLNWGIVAKTDIAEIREPFIRAGFVAGITACFLILIGAAMFYRVTNPILERLFESETRTRNIIDTAVDGIITIDRTGVVQSINPAGQRIFGYSDDEVIGQKVNMLMPRPYSQEHDGYLEKYRLTGEAGIIGKGREVAGLRKDGTEFPMHLSVSEFRVENQRMYTGFVQDISKRKKMEATVLENEAKIRAIVETAEDAIVTIDEHGTIESVNSSVERLFGYSAEETVGRPISLLIPAPAKQADEEDLTGASPLGTNGFGAAGQAFGRRKGGTLFPVRVSFSEFRIGTHKMFAGYFHDLTEQKQLQEQILQSERLAVIGKMAAKVAHELRNPLSSISLNAEILEDEIDGLEPGKREEARNLLAAMIREIDRVASLTDEYLHFSRLPTAAPTQGNLSHAVCEVLDMLAPEFKQKNVSLRTAGLDVAVVIPFDYEQIRRVLLNIVRNAVEAMPGGGDLCVSTEKADGQAVISIQDSGPGISEELIGNIFNPFFTTKDFGTGLGLAITQQIIHEHCGQIFCSSKVGEGTTFRIELPAAEEQKVS